MNLYLFLFFKSLHASTQHVAKWTRGNMNLAENEHLEKIILFLQMIARWRGVGSLPAAYQ